MRVVPVVEMAEEPGSKFELSAFGGNDSKMLQRPCSIIRPSANAPYFPNARLGGLFRLIDALECQQIASQIGAGKHHQIDAVRLVRSGLENLLSHFDGPLGVAMSKFHLHEVV